MTSQMTTKLIQTTQGLATFVQTQGPRMASAQTLLSTNSPANKINPIQLQYLRQGGALIRQHNPAATATTASQQQAMHLKEQAQHQLKRIQVVTSGSPTVNVSSTQGAQGMTMSSVTVVPSSSIFTQVTASSSISAFTISASPTQKVSSHLFLFFFNN